MIIKYRTIREYGHDRKYIDDPKIEEVIKKLTGKMTLNDEIIESLSILGINCKEV